MTTIPPRCFMTFFVSRYDNLVAAKHHYQRRIDMVRQRYQVVFAPEQAYGDGNDSALFETGWYTARPHTTPSRRMSAASSCFLPLSWSPMRQSRRLLACLMRILGSL